MNKPKMVPFVLHRHEAKRAGLHYDLRIKYPNKKLLASWAIPSAKIPQNNQEKVLAVQTPDHGKYWLYFEGDIPDGEYGAGSIKIIQKGNVEILGWSSNHITFKASGDPLNGKYTLIKFSPKKSENENTWLLIKSKD